MVIDYVLDACRKTKAVDKIVIVASEQYVEFFTGEANHILR
jgi:spore coat polysaccharide biosynthesis protein SpsF (cytidylyltransferase family)